MLEKILETFAHLISDNRILFSGASLLITGLFTASCFVEFLTKNKNN